MTELAARQACPLDGAFLPSLIDRGLALETQPMEDCDVLSRVQIPSTARHFAFPIRIKQRPQFAAHHPVPVFRQFHRSLHQPAHHSQQSGFGGVVRQQDHEFLIAAGASSGQVVNSGRFPWDYTRIRTLTRSLGKDPLQAEGIRRTRPGFGVCDGCHDGKVAGLRVRTIIFNYCSGVFLRMVRWQGTYALRA